MDRAGTQLIVGVNSARETENGLGIAECKGFPPVLTDDERQTAVAGCRFVHDVVPNVPYIMSEKFLSHVVEKYVQLWPAVPVFGVVGTVQNARRRVVLI